jgi:hypothetical protein
MAVSLLLTAVGVIGQLGGIGASWVLVAAGMIGWTTTVGRCVTFAWRSDLSGLPAIGRWSHAQSRGLYRALIAWLHLLQPVARFSGNLRGLSLSQGVTPQHVTRHPWRTPVPALRDVRAAAHLLARGGTAWSFWSESPVAQTTLLTELVGVLRASRPAPLVHVDDGWHPDRDLSMAIGRWGWLHVETLVEEHERGCSLFRARARLRPSVGGMVQSLIVAMLVAGGTSASMVLTRPSLSVIVSAMAIAAIGVRAAWQATRAVAILDRALARVTTAAGMLPLPLPAARAARVGRSVETTLSGG